MRTALIRSFCAGAIAVAAAGVGAASAAAQESALYAPSVWDLRLGQHARELPTAQFIDFACGTDGGPPSRRLAGWTDFAACRAEPRTGLHEVYFAYDDEPEYQALARRDRVRAALYEYTSVYSRPVIASALFDDDGFFRALRLVTDPRVPVHIREDAQTLAGFIQARYDGAWDCRDLPRVDGETPYRGNYVKRACTLEDAPAGVRRDLEAHLYRKPGQEAIDPVTRLPTEGAFESTTRYQETLLADIPDRAARLAALAARPEGEVPEIVRRARDCPGCDLRGVDLKRAGLRGARLAGADLSGANLHGADLAEADLRGARLDGANLNRALLTRADLTGASLTGVMAYGASADGARLVGVVATALLAGRIRLISADLTDAAIVESDFLGARITGATGPRAAFRRCSLDQADLSRSILPGAVFTNASMIGAVLNRTGLAGARLDTADLTGADFTGADLTDADLSRSWLTSAILVGAKLAGARFDGARLPAGFAPP